MASASFRWMVFGSSLVCLVLAGCARNKPGPVLVDARNSRSFTAWRAETIADHTPDAWRKFDQAVTEIRFAIEREENPPQGEARNEEVCRRINGRSFDDVIRLGLMMQRQRLEALRSSLADMVDANALIVARPGDDASAAELKRMLDNQQNRLDAMTRQIAAIDQELSPAGTVLANGPVSEARTGAKPLGRAEALREIDALIGSRQVAGELKFGAWPVRINAAGDMLPPRVRAEYEARLRAAAGTDHTVLPVRIRGIWWIFDQKVATPRFSPAVTANLTLADVAGINVRWARTEAEEWVRNELHQLSDTDLAAKLDQARAEAAAMNAQSNLTTPAPPVKVDVGATAPIDVGNVTKPEIVAPVPAK